MKQQVVLVATAGESPKVMGQGVYFLEESREKPREVVAFYVLHTEKSKKALDEWPTKLQVACKENNWVGISSFDVPYLKSVGTTQVRREGWYEAMPLGVKDLATENDLKVAAANTAFHITEIREKHPGIPIVMDFTGGRVGMSFYAALAEMLYGGPDDEILYTIPHQPYLYDPTKRDYWTETHFYPRVVDHVTGVTFPFPKLRLLPFLISDWYGKSVSHGDTLAKLPSGVERLEDLALMALNVRGLDHDLKDLVRLLGDAIDQLTQPGSSEASPSGGGRTPRKLLSFVASILASYRQMGDRLMEAKPPPAERVLPPPAERVLLREAIESCVALATTVRSGAPHQCRGSQIDTSSVNHGHTVSAPRALLERLLFLPLDNAVKYTRPENRAIRISTRSGDGRIEVVIEDNGPGLPKGVRGPELLQPVKSPDLYRLLDNRQDLGDLGKQGKHLGLAFAQRLLEVVAGVSFEIGLENTVSASGSVTGVTVTIPLPVAPAP